MGCCWVASPHPQRPTSSPVLGVWGRSAVDPHPPRGHASTIIPIASTVFGHRDDIALVQTVADVAVAVASTVNATCRSHRLTGGSVLLQSTRQVRHTTTCNSSSTTGMPGGGTSGSER